MYKRWLELKAKAEKKPPQPAAAGGLQWIEAAESPFGVRMLDCRPLTQTMMAFTSDPSVAEHFMARDKQGESYRGQQPDHPLTIPCDLSYPYDSPALTEGPVFLAHEMEDKWDIFYLDGAFLFVRSWTGQVLALAAVRIEDDRLRIDSIVADGEVVQGDAAYATRDIDFMVKSHLFNQPHPHPIPPGVEDDPQRIAIFGFSQYGRRAWFATYADTTRLRIERPDGEA